MDGRTILLVDDEPLIIATLGRYLRASGYGVVTAGNADDAFEVLRQSSIDAAILDVRLPNARSGLEILQMVRIDDDSRNLPVMLLTGVKLTADEEDIVRKYPAHVFYKPHGYADIVAHLKRVLYSSAAAPAASA